MTKIEKKIAAIKQAFEIKLGSKSKFKSLFSLNLIAQVIKDLVSQMAALQLSFIKTALLNTLYSSN